MLYKRNHILHKSKAFQCIISFHKVGLFTYFFNDEHLHQDTKEFRAVSAAQCQSMVQWRKCDHGPLIQVGNILATNNKLKINWPSGGTQCCRWHEEKVTNCHLVTTTVFVTHDNNLMMESPSGQVAHCTYTKGSCQLQDGSHLLWKPNQNASCSILPWKKINGQKFGHYFLSNDHNLALTFNKPKIIRDCKNRRTVQLSDQGIPMTYLHIGTESVSDPRGISTSRGQTSTRRVARISPSHNRTANSRIARNADFPTDGVVTTDILAASLQALEVQFRDSLRFSYTNALKDTCQAMQQVVQILRASAMINPTLVSRVLLNRTDIHALAAGGALEVFPCMPLPINRFQFEHVNNTCYRDIPINYELVEGVKRRGFLDPRTNIIHEFSPQEHCDLIQEIPIKFGMEFLLYNYMSGTAVPLKHARTLSLLKFNSTFDDWALDPIIFTQHILYNWSMSHQYVNLNDLVGTLSQHREIFESLGIEFSQSTHDAVTELSANVVEKGYFGFLKGFSISPFQVWTFLCCFYVTLLFLGLHCVPPGIGISSMLNIPQLCVRGFTAIIQRIRNFRQLPNEAISSEELDEELPTATEIVEMAANSNRDIPFSHTNTQERRRSKLRSPFRSHRSHYSRRSRQNEAAVRATQEQRDMQSPLIQEFIQSLNQRQVAAPPAIPMVTFPSSNESSGHTSAIMDAPGRRPYVVSPSNPKN